MASKHILDQSRTIPHQCPLKKHPKSTNTFIQNCKKSRMAQQTTKTPAKVDAKAKQVAMATKPEASAETKTSILKADKMANVETKSDVESSSAAKPIT